MVILGAIKDSSAKAIDARSKNKITTFIFFNNDARKSETMWCGVKRGGQQQVIQSHFVIYLFSILYSFIHSLLFFFCFFSFLTIIIPSFFLYSFIKNFMQIHPRTSCATITLYHSLFSSFKSLRHSSYNSYWGFRYSLYILRARWHINICQQYMKEHKWEKNKEERQRRWSTRKKKKELIRCRYDSLLLLMT